LREHGVRHGGTGGNSDQYRRQIRGIVEIGLDEVTQIFQIAIGENALIAIGFEVRLELRPIDAGDHRALLHELPSHGVRGGIPAFVARQEQHKTRRRRRGLVDGKIPEAAMTQTLCINGHRRGSRGGHRARAGRRIGG
jgi:hypothetical protein